MPAAVNVENVDTTKPRPPEIDKTYATINYPRDLSSVLKALETIDLDSNTKLAIIVAYAAMHILRLSPFADHF
jgi:hypothetical protein